MTNEKLENGGSLTILLDGEIGRYTAKLQELKHMVMNYHTSEEYQKIIDYAISAAQRLRHSPEDLRIFRELYIERGMTVRRFSEEHHMSVRTVYKRADSVFKKFMPIVYGVDGIPFEE